MGNNETIIYHRLLAKNLSVSTCLPFSQTNPNGPSQTLWSASVALSYIFVFE